MTVLDILTKNKGRTVKRSELSSQCNIPDRKVRQQIENLRMSGIFIVNNQDGNGYKLISEDDIDALREQYRQMRKRALNILKQTTPIRRQIRKLEKENEHGEF